MIITAADIDGVLAAGTMKTWDRVRLNDKDWSVAASKHSGKQGEIREIAFGPTGGNAVAEHVKTLSIAYTGEVAPKLLAVGTRFHDEIDPVSWSDHELPVPTECVTGPGFRGVSYDIASFDLYFGVMGTAVMRVEYQSDCDLYAHVVVALYQEREEKRKDLLKLGEVDEALREARDLRGSFTRMFRHRLRDWMDFDGAEDELAKCLGLVPDGPWDPLDKGRYWSTNPLGDALHDILKRLVVLGALEYDEEEQRYRWNQNYNESVSRR